jgi:hypothetical protein
MPVSAEARLGAKLADLKNEPLMTQFAIRALIKGAASQARVYELSPLGTKVADQIKMKLQFDAEERLIHVEMHISHAFQKEDPSAAKRYAAWFLLTQMPLQDTAAIKPLATEAEYRTESKNHHILGDIPELPAKPSQGYQALLGRATYSQSYKKSKLNVTQTKSDGGWTKIRLEPK